MLRTAALAATISVGLALSLSGCFANPLDQLTEGLVEGGVEQIIEQGSGVDVNFGEGAALPSDWPAELPVPDGEIIVSGSAEGASTLAMNTTEALAESGLADLLDAGFTVVQEQAAEGTKLYILENDAYSVSYAWATGAEDGIVFLQYGVTPKG